MSTPNYEAAWTYLTVDDGTTDSTLFNEQEFTDLPQTVGTNLDVYMYDTLSSQMQEFSEKNLSDQKESADHSSLTSTNQPCNFQLIFPEENILHNVPKSRRCHYSNKLKILYVKEDQACPFTFSCDDLNFPADVDLRATVIYVRREDAKIPVKRCSDHMVVGQGGSHLMSSQYEDAVYNSSNNMMSVLVPFECGHKGDVGYTFIFEFACRSSCKTPLKNKPMAVKFTLERRNVVIGQDSVAVKISSSPYRDMTNAEEKTDAASKPSRKRKLKSSCAVGDQTYEAMVHEDIAFAQYARRRHPEWWNEYHQDEGCSTSNGSD
ncbi:cellular tumor antigen p53-like isoform X2 [Corticium candelabrum]|uniref:cellular tumor antigen p53-like isoform X2 n=1 Tax=Corticium candelabrum TaxID=121492 RepID=UPI002E2741BB|nr:cellular tumor antigen p53-like isoform X2 [Corticium candelabrum]